VDCVQSKRCLDLFSGTGSVSQVLEGRGYEVTTLDMDPRFKPKICADVRSWDYQKYPPGYFDIVTASPPCTEFSKAKTVGERKLTQALEVVEKTLEIIKYFNPPVWWLETPRYGLLTKSELMRDIPCWDCDYCQFALLGCRKPTRFYGSAHLTKLQPTLCDGETCPNLAVGRRHKHPLGGHWGSGGASKKRTYPIPEGVVLMASGLNQEKPTSKVSSEKALRRVRFAADTPKGTSDFEQEAEIPPKKSQRWTLLPPE